MIMKVSNYFFTKHTKDLYYYSGIGDFFNFLLHIFSLFFHFGGN